MSKSLDIAPLISLAHIPDLLTFFENDCKVIVPSFPNWQKSFVSGFNGPLFEIEHRFHEGNPSLLVSKIKFKSKAEGPPAHVHGGATAGLIDELMGIMVWHDQQKCVTQNLSLHYWKPLPLAPVCFAVTKISAHKETTIDVLCTLFNEKKSPYVSSQGLFHKLTEKQLKRFSV